MNVLFLTHYAGNGGASVALLSLTDGLKKYGVQSYVLLPCDGKLMEELDDRNISYAKYPFRAGVINKKFMKSPIFPLKRMHNVLRQFLTAIYILYYSRKWNIDIIHANSTYVICGALAGMLNGKPSVWHLREQIDAHFNSVFFPFEKVMKFLVKKTGRIIAVSDYVKNYYESLLPGSEGRITTVYDGAAVSVRKSSDSFHSPVNIVYCGGGQLSKGWPDVCLICQGLKQRHFTDYVIWMSGCRRETLEEYLIKTNQDRELLQKVRIFEGMSKRDFDAFRTDMDILFQPSAAEAFGLVTAEAMLIGLPVIAVNSAANRELIEDGISGFLYEKNDSDGIAGKILWLIENHEARASMIKKARERAGAYYTPEENAAQIYQIYHHLWKSGDI